MSLRVTFLGVEIEAGPGALVPRAETELCGRTAIEKLRGGVTFIDVCCGTGNLACAIATAVPGARGWALDLTDGCVALARANVARLGLADRIEVAQGDLFAPISHVREIDLITCNPPYISTSKLATRDDLAAEPREAFDGGPYGVTIHQRVAKDALALLRGGGWLVMELGLGQERQLKIVLERARGYDTIEFIPDEHGAPRVVAARRAQSL
ncbi:MAG TPA: HemK family protein methyltransferase [Kofleriaceae bacterium]|nr:HemK family protein methyltransferase [Kofleriaceae bacterium]